MVERDGSAKGIVFSQFTSFLDLINYSLHKVNLFVTFCFINACNMHQDDNSVNCSLEYLAFNWMEAWHWLPGMLPLRDLPMIQTARFFSWAWRPEVLHSIWLSRHMWAIPHFGSLLCWSLHCWQLCLVIICCSKFLVYNKVLFSFNFI